VGGAGNDTLSGGKGGDYLAGGTGIDTFKYTAVTDSQPGTVLTNVANYDTITLFEHGIDHIKFFANITGGTNLTVQGTLATSATGVNAHSVAWFYNGTDTVVYVNTNATGGSTQTPGSTSMEIHLTGNIALSSADFAFDNIAVQPAGIAGSPINLGLTQPSAPDGMLVTVSIGNLPAGWTLLDGTQLADGSWTMQTPNVQMLAVATPTNFTGAAVLNITETWIGGDGTTASLMLNDNVEAFAVAAPIFAWSGDDFLTGSSGHDLFVFSQPIGHDVVYSFDAMHDKIDLIGYAGFSSFADIQAQIADDSAGNAVITLGDGQSITLHGVAASMLSASDFVFNATPVTENPGSMVISNGAILPLSGTIDNAGHIALNSSGNETDLQLIEHGITLQGGGHVDLSDSSDNVISGTASDVTLTNVDNTISGAGHLGGGMMALINEGTIIATGNNALDIDTGTNAIVNSGTLEATGSGGLIIHSDVMNQLLGADGITTSPGLLWANGGNITIDGNVSGGTALISGSATLEFAATSAENTAFASGSTGTLALDDAFHFTGIVSGMAEGNHLDLLDFNFANATLKYDPNAAGTGGTLTVTDATHTANIALLGQYDPTAFQTEADKGVGTLISYHHLVA
jgi:hypothetical protein